VPGKALVEILGIKSILDPSQINSPKLCWRRSRRYMTLQRSSLLRRIPPYLAVPRAPSVGVQGSSDPLP
jgi:hypothetical protein